MSTPYRNKWLRSITGLAGILTLSSLQASAQCALCNAAAAASGSRGIQALKDGIWTLLIPTLLMFGIVVLLLVRRRDEPGESSASFAMSEEELALAEDSLLPLRGTPDRNATHP